MSSLYETVEEAVRDWYAEELKSVKISEHEIEEDCERLIEVMWSEFDNEIGTMTREKKDELEK